MTAHSGYYAKPSKRPRYSHSEHAIPQVSGGDSSDTETNGNSDPMSVPSILSDSPRGNAAPRMVALSKGLETSITAALSEGESLSELILTVEAGIRRYTQRLNALQVALRDVVGVCCVEQQQQQQQQQQKQQQQTQRGTTAKRPLSDFNFFCRDARRIVTEAHPEYSKEQVNKTLGRIWAMLDGRMRAHYRDMYLKDRQRYRQDVARIEGKQGKGALLEENGGLSRETVRVAIRRFVDLDGTSGGSIARILNRDTGVSRGIGTPSALGPIEDFDIPLAHSLLPAACVFPQHPQGIRLEPHRHHLHHLRLSQYHYSGSQSSTSTASSQETDGRCSGDRHTGPVSSATNSTPGTCLSSASTTPPAGSSNGINGTGSSSIKRPNGIPMELLLAPPLAASVSMPSQ